MALNRITGLGMVVLGSSMLLAVACDSGGTTASPTNVGGSTAANNTGAGGNTNTTVGGTTSANTSAISGSTGGKTSTSAGGTSAASTAVKPTCPSTYTPPSGTGTLSVTSGYVTAGSFAGYGFTWTGDKSIGDTCITPKCGDTGCTPLFPASALCAAGVVALDENYDSIAGVGFNLKQASSGSNTPQSVSAGSSITVGVTFSGDSTVNTGNSAARVQVVDSAGVSYCVDAGAWTSGSAIDITSFNTTCWDGKGTALASGASLVSLHIIVPSDSTSERPFSFCLTDFAM